jgi:D-glycero-alpha-D-manno-heptose 1-phosphate guanylyltransferase
VGGEPFLVWVLRWLERVGLERVVLSVGYCHEAVVSAIGSRFGGLLIDYVIEKEPLGTGGAIALALGRCKTRRILCTNGDTYFDVDVEKMASETEGADIAIALRQVPDVGRFGVVDCRDGRVAAFAEKRGEGAGLINGGTYLLDRPRLQSELPRGSFSFERQFLEPRLHDFDVRGFVANGYFIDIGVPDSLAEAQRDLARFAQNLPIRAQ